MSAKSPPPQSWWLASDREYFFEVATYRVDWNKFMALNLITHQQSPRMLVNQRERILQRCELPVRTNKDGINLLEYRIAANQPQNQGLTISPPTTVVNGFTFSIWTGSSWKMSSERTVKSASLPGASDPLMSSWLSAYAEPTV